MRFLNHVNNTRPCRPRRILCVSKLTSLEYLRSQNADLDVDQILSRMKGEGLNPDDILAEHQRQIACEQNLISVLNKLDISFRITKRYRQEESYYVIYFNARWNSWLRLCTATNVRREKDIYIYVRWNVTRKCFLHSSSSSHPVLTRSPSFYSYIFFSAKLISRVLIKNNQV